MKLITQLLIFTPLLLLIGSLNLDTNELIRIKIENLSINKKLNCGAEVQCINTLPDFYRDRAFEALWNSTNTNEFIEIIKQASQEGLNPNDYHLAALEKVQKANLGNNEKAEIDILLSDAFLLYSSHLLSGKVNPESINAEWHVTRREGRPTEVLDDALRTNKIKGAIAGILPKHKTYESLKQALKRLSQINESNWPPLISDKSLKPGQEDDLVPELRNRLKLLNDLATSQASVSKIYDNELEVAVKVFQERHGLEADGIIGGKTFEALNIPLEKRIERVKVNMERWRWMPQEFGQFYIKVNIANYWLEVWKNGDLIGSYKSIIGKPYRSTPVMSSQLQYLVFNPTWTVPPGILANDILPAVKKDPKYLEKKGLIVMNQSGVVLDPLTIDWNSSAVKGYTYRQPAGPNNALGVVKFIFPNKFNVYIHDTPSKELFNISERALSSGCVRVEKPLALAELLLNDPLWNTTKILETIKIGESKTVYFKDQPKVHILYWTAWSSNGKINFRKDIYNRDDRLYTALQSKPTN